LGDEEYEVLFETTIRYVRPKSGNIDAVRMALFSLSVDDVGVQIYKYLSERKMATPEEISRELKLSEDEVIARLDYLYSLGLIDKLGRAYSCDASLAEAIRRRTSKRILGILRRLAEMLEGEANG